MGTQIRGPEESPQCMSLALCLLVSGNVSFFLESLLACLCCLLDVCMLNLNTSQVLNGIQKDTHISINKLGIQRFLRANQGRLINLASCLINEL